MYRHTVSPDSARPRDARAAIRERTRPIGHVSGHDSILGTHKIRITGRNSGQCQGHDNQERRIPASAVLTAAWSNGWGSCGSSSDGYSTGSRLRTRRTPGRPVSSVIVFCRVISAPPPDLNLVLHVPACRCRNCVALCHLGVFAGQTAEPVPAQNLYVGAESAWIRTPGRRLLFQCPGGSDLSRPSARRAGYRAPRGEGPRPRAPSRGRTVGAR